MTIIDTILFSALLITLVILTTIYFYLNVYIPFRKKKDYLKTEVMRADNEANKKYWQKALKRFYLKQIPFIGKHLAKKIK